jgi:hypothetical protein
MKTKSVDKNRESHNCCKNAYKTQAFFVNAFCQAFCLTFCSLPALCKGPPADNRFLTKVPRMDSVQGQYGR